MYDYFESYSLRCRESFSDFDDPSNANAAMHDVNDDGNLGLLTTTVKADRTAGQSFFDFRLEIACLLENLPGRNSNN